MVDEVAKDFAEVIRIQVRRTLAAFGAGREGLAVRDMKLRVEQTGGAAKVQEARVTSPETSSAAAWSMPWQTVLLIVVTVLTVLFFIDQYVEVSWRGTTPPPPPAPGVPPKS